MATEPQATFVSYSRDDSDFALRLAEDLKSAGASVWLDQLDIKPGQRWARAVQDALTDSPRILVILSPSSVESTNVDDEISFALEEHKTVIPVLYRDCKIPFRLRPYQYIDFRTDYSRGLKIILNNLGVEQSTHIEQPPRNIEPSTLLNISPLPAARTNQQTDLADTHEEVVEKVRPEAKHKTPKKTRPEQEPRSLASSPLPRYDPAPDAAPPREPSPKTIEQEPSPQTSSTHAYEAALNTGSSQEPFPQTVHDEHAPIKSFLARVPVRTKVIVICGTLTLTLVVSWLVRPHVMPQSSGVTSFLASVAFASPQSGWVVGDDGTILHTENGGNNWKPQSSGITAKLVSVAFVTPQSGWAVGDKGTILHTEDGGNYWKPQNSGTTADLESVAFATPQSGWAVGDDGAILHTENSGSNWTPQSSGTTAFLLSVAFATPQSGWAVGTGHTILHTENGGISWKSQSTSINWPDIVNENDTKETLWSVASVSPQSGWVAGDDGIILHTGDGGNSWKLQNKGGYNLRSITFVSPQSGWAVGSGKILHTDDGGGNWKPQRILFDLRSVAFVTAQSGWVISDDGAILHTEDGGNSWKPQRDRTKRTPASQ